MTASTKRARAPMGAHCPKIELVHQMRAAFLARLRQTGLIAGLALLALVILTACSTPTTTAPPPPPTTTAETRPPTLTPPAPAPTQTPVPVENTPTSLPATVEPVEATPTPIPATSTPEATPTLAAGATRVFPIDGMVQVYVPAGEFIMGASDKEAKQTIEGGRAYPEIPQHVVYLDSYWIDKYEVTNSQYALCVAAGVCRPPFNPAAYTYPHYYDNPEFANYPVIWVNWYMARQYCEWAGRRLPTEAEWEKAARGTDGRMYPWGNEEISGDKANFCDINCTRTIANDRYNDGYPDVAPVGSYPAGASPYGALDMAGNVWEWTSTLVQPYPYDANDGREDPNVVYERVWRGGPWSNGIWWMRSSVRYRSVMNYWWYNLGFRCAASPDQPPR